jgi:glucose-1-phosphate thymidylyltransferase
LAGIKEILIISTSEDLPRFQKLLGNGSELGIKFEYIIQPSPDGIAQAFILGKNFINNDDVCLILGDNIYYGQGLTHLLLKATKEVQEKKVATVFSSYVNDPERYGVVSFDKMGYANTIEEKPQKPKSNYAVTGLYFYPNDVVQKSLKLKPSDRGELEITSLNQIYLNENRLKVILMGRGYAWLDAGTHESLLEASNFIETIERRQGLKVACIEEIAYRKKYISKNQIIELAKPLAKNQYGQYLLKLVGDGN